MIFTEDQTAYAPKCELYWNIKLKADPHSLVLGFDTNLLAQDTLRDALGNQNSIVHSHEYGESPVLLIHYFF